MSPPSSTLLSVQPIPNAGRGIAANRFILKDTLLLRSEPPPAHVVFREYRKQVCALCFHYDRGRTLPFKHDETGKVFCTADCRTGWLNERGELGLAAWRSLHAFVQSKSKKISKDHSVPLLAEKPDVEEILSSWTKTDRLRQLRTRESITAAKQRSHHPSQSVNVDPDLLAFLLSGVLFHHDYPQKWQEDILDLAMDDRPYRSTLDLQAHCSSYIQLAAILPYQVLPDLTAQACQTLISAAGHNSFGIRSGSEDGEEYMGYALYPDASYFNHSCHPNVSKKRTGHTWNFRASRDIHEGEQCCITYLDGDEKDLGVSARRARLEMHWGFECGCQRCLEETEI